MPLRTLSAAVAAACLLTGCVSSGIAPTAWYANHGGAAPQHLTLTICHGFGCTHVTRVALADADLAALAGIMARGEASPAAERGAIAEAVMWVERRVGPVVGSDDDIGGLDLWNAGTVGQMDCLDETTNTTSTMVLLAENGLLTHHAVRYPVARGFFLDGRYPHATAVIRETASETDWAIDPWPYANGADVDVMPLSEWYAVWPSSG